jgi:hypothetical protein
MDFTGDHWFPTNRLSSSVTPHTAKAQRFDSALARRNQDAHERPAWYGICCGDMPMERTTLASLILAFMLAGLGCGETTRDVGQRDIGVAGAATGDTDISGAARGGTGADDAPGGQGGTVQVAGSGGAAAGAGGAGGAPPVECRQRDDDPTGYLVLICEFLIAHADTIYTAVDPNSYNIERIEPRTEDGREVLYVWLDCCFMGDYAVIDAETGEVIAFSVGDV